MRNLIVVSAFLAIIALIGCTKSKKASGGECASKADCADGLSCYIIGINFKCFTKAEADVICKASPLCKTGGKCRAMENTTQASSPEHYMGGCE